MKLMSILSAETKAALGVRPKPQPKPVLPARLARRRGVIPSKLLAFEAMVERNRIGSEVRRWMRQEVPEHRLAVDIISQDILDDASKRVLRFRESPTVAVPLAAALNFQTYMPRSARRPFGELRASAEAALVPHIQG